MEALRRGTHHMLVTAERPPPIKAFFDTAVAPPLPPCCAQVDLGTGEVGQAVVCGLRHVCAILVGGSVKCWGDNRSGQLGLGHVATMGDDADELGDNLPFVDLGSGGTATSLSLGESHSCAVLGDGSVR